jgi:hypothetical protein
MRRFFAFLKLAAKANKYNQVSLLTVRKLRSKFNLLGTRLALYGAEDIKGYLLLIVILIRHAYGCRATPCHRNIGAG